MNDLRDFFKLLRYLLIFLVVVVGMAFYSNAYAAWTPPQRPAGDVWFSNTYDDNCGVGVNCQKNPSAAAAAESRLREKVAPNIAECSAKSGYWWDEFVNSEFYGHYKVGLWFACMKQPWKPEEPCKTPKTDEQCKKGQRRQVTLPKSFWSQSTAEHKGCVISVESPGVGIANMDDNTATGHVNMMGSTGKEWCANTGTSDTTAQSIGSSGQFTPTTTPKDCPKGSVTMGGQSWCYTGASDGVTKPDGSVPDDGIHDNGTSDDGNGGDVDSSIDREPGDGSGGDGGGGGGGGSGGGTGEGDGISKGDIKDGVKEGVEEALGKGSGAPAPIVLPTVDDVEGGINGVMGRYKQRINNAPISNAFNSISFSVPSAGCSPWGIHLDYLDVSLQFDQCTFLNTHSGMIGAIMMAMFAGLSIVVFLKA